MHLYFEPSIAPFHFSLHSGEVSDYIRFPIINSLIYSCTIGFYSVWVIYFVWYKAIPIDCALV